MNILLMTFAYLPSTGGVQRSVSNLAAQLAGRGHHVTIVCDGPWSGIEASGLQRGTPADVLVLKIPTRFHWGRIHKLRSWCRDVYNCLRLAILCRRRRIQIVHCHLINVDTGYAVFLKKLLGVRMVVTLRGDELSTWIYGKQHRIDYVRTMLRSADAVTALSQGQVDAARVLEPSLHAPMEVIPNPALIEPILAAVDTSTTPPSNPYFLFVGRLVDFKSLDTLIEAYHGVVAGNPSFPIDLVLVGGGELDHALREQASRGPGAARIQFLGERSWGQALRLIQAAHFLILPSYDSEGCPNVLLEAMALGTPVIVSDYPTQVEMITAGVNGEVFPCRDAKALQACLERMSLDEERRDAYAREGRRYLSRRHQPDRILEAYEALYKRLCSGDI
jgi:glycosyltransferase involved in cell wall biosynthesis